MQMRVPLIALLGSALLLPGCAASIIAATTTSASEAAKTSGTQVDQAQIDEFRKGVTTVADVRAKLGEPQQTARNSDGSVAALTYTSKSAEGNAQSHVAFARWAEGSETTITTRTVSFAFDAGGRLTNTNASESSLTCRFGHCPE